MASALKAWTFFNPFNSQRVHFFVPNNLQIGGFKADGLLAIIVKRSPFLYEVCDASIDLTYAIMRPILQYCCETETVRRRLSRGESLPRRFITKHVWIQLRPPSCLRPSRAAVYAPLTFPRKEDPKKKLYSKRWSPPLKQIAAYKALKAFTVYAWDIESFSKVHMPFQLAVVRFDKPTEPWAYFDNWGIDIFLPFINRLVAQLLNGEPDSFHLFLSYNGAGYDHFPLVECWYRNAGRFPHISTTFCRGGGGRKIVLFQLENKCRNVTVSFRDAMQYLPAPDRGALSKVAKICNSPWLKHEGVTVEDIDRAALLEPYLRATDANYQRIKAYNVADCAAVFGVAMYYGKLFSSIETINAAMLAVNPNLDPEIVRQFGIFFYGFTLANLTWATTQYAIPTDVVNLPIVCPKKYSGAMNKAVAKFLQTCIYGGRTLVPGWGLIFSKRWLEDHGAELDAIDVSSMYPQAACSPLPCGDSFYATDLLKERISNALAMRDFNPYHYPPFCSHIRFRKPRVVRHVATVFKDFVVHHPLDLLPVVPDRPEQSKFFTEYDLIHKRTPGLEWINDTNGEWYEGNYTCVDILTMLDVGFEVELLQNALFPQVVCWRGWGTEIKEVMHAMYKLKANAKSQWSRILAELRALATSMGLNVTDFERGNYGSYPDPEEIKRKFNEIEYWKALEKAYKLFLNGFVGKTAERISERVDSENPLLSGLVRIKGTLFQLNAFCMSGKNRITLGMACWLAYNDAMDIKRLVACKTPMLRVPICGDTDNIIYLQAAGSDSDEDLRQTGMMADGKLGPFDTKTGLYHFKLETETWHVCTNGKIRRHRLFFGCGRKFYQCQCDICGKVRSKQKGHRPLVQDPITKEWRGFDPNPIVDAFNKEPLYNALFLRAGSFQMATLQETFLDWVYPRQPITVPPSSGEFFYIRATMPTKDELKFGLANSTIKRRIGIIAPHFLQTCPVCFFTCIYVSKHDYSYDLANAPMRRLALSDDDD